MANFLISRNPAIARLVERQMRNWELAREQRPESDLPPRCRVEDFRLRLQTDRHRGSRRRCAAGRRARLARL